MNSEEKRMSSDSDARKPGPVPVRRSDVIEGQWERALVWAGFGILAILIGFFVLNYGSNWGKSTALKTEGVDFTPLAYPLLIAGPLLLIFAATKAFSGKQVTSYTATCPYCGHDMEFVEQPGDDFSCDECHRRVPVLNGKILDITGVRCGFCGALNFMSEKTKVLLCEECDREIALLNPETGEMRHAAKGFARVDDNATYELVLVAVPKDKASQDSLTSALQHMLALNRNQVHKLYEELPSILLRGINKRKAEMLRAQIEACEGTGELRPIS